jgi:hypothetical protein
VVNVQWLLNDISRKLDVIQRPLSPMFEYIQLLLMYMETTLNWVIGVHLTFRRQFFEIICFYSIFYLIYYNDIHDILSYKVIYILFIFTYSWISFFLCLIDSGYRWQLTWVIIRYRKMYWFRV